MTRPQNAPPVAADPDTGEVIDIPYINTELVRLHRVLGEMDPKIRGLLEEQQVVSLRYEVVYSTAVLASQQRSEDRRRAEALLRVAEVTLEDSEEPLASRKARLEVEIRALRDFGHDVRARLTALQSVANNLRTAARIEGYQP